MALPDEPPARTTTKPKRILVTGATGYVGGRLVPQLLHRGYTVRCMAREPRSLTGRFADETDDPARLEIVAGDVLDPDSLKQALADVDAAYYLIHAMTEGEKGFAERDENGARNFGQACRTAGVGRIIYLGGLGCRDERTSEHLHSRHVTGDILRESGVPVTEFRAAVIVGSGSASFEMLRTLTEKLPIMVVPKWVETRTQPIFITDAVNYLATALECPESTGRVLDIGGPDVLTYKQMMLTYADVRGLKRVIYTVPLLTPRLSAYWVNLVTPVPASIAFPLIEGLKSETIVENDDARRLIPIPLTPFREAVARAIRATDEYRVPTRWSGASNRTVPLYLDEARSHTHRLIRNQQVMVTTASETMLSRAISRIGGRVGWYYADYLWDIRGAMDRLIGGVGVRRGRRHPENLQIGDALDFWRVEDYNRDHLLLRAEMKVPGRAWLEFDIKEQAAGSNESVPPVPGATSLPGSHRVLTQTAYYIPFGFFGYAYWYASLPFHLFVFGGMARNIVRWAEKNERIEAEVHANNLRTQREQQSLPPTP